MLIRQTYRVGQVDNLGGQNVVVLDWLQVPFLVSLNINIISGNCDYFLEYTMDDVDDINADWDPLPGMDPVTPLNTTILYTIQTPMIAVRLNLVSLTGEVRFTALQSPKLF